MKEIKVESIDYIILKFDDGTEGKIYKIENLPLDNYLSVIEQIEKMNRAESVNEKNRYIVEIVYSCTEGIDREKFFKKINYKQALEIYNAIMENIEENPVEAKKKDLGHS